MGKLVEIREELNALFGDQGVRFFDATVPVIIYLLFLLIVGNEYAWVGGVLAAVFLTLFRILRKENLWFALGGAGGVLLATALAANSKTGIDFYLPGLLSNAVVIAACLVSLIINRPLLALTSKLLRNWPLDWYLHPKIRPAYREATFVWVILLGLRLLFEAWLYINGEVTTLGVSRIVFGWPFYTSLLIATYLYGIWRLGKLAGPSVVEFESNQPPPWQSQKRGF